MEAKVSLTHVNVVPLEQHVWTVSVCLKVQRAYEDDITDGMFLLLGACGTPLLSLSCVYPHGDPWLET